MGQADSLPYIGSMHGRLRTSAEFGRVKREGSYWSGKRCSINAARRPIVAEETDHVTGQVLDDDKPARVGLITSKRIGSAVQRNRARRLMREAMRSLEMTIEPSWDIVVIAQPAISAPDVRMQDVRDELLWLLKKARLTKPS